MLWSGRRWLTGGLEAQGGWGILPAHAQLSLRVSALLHATARPASAPGPASRQLPPHPHPHSVELSSCRQGRTLQTPSSAYQGGIRFSPLLKCPAKCLLPSFVWWVFHITCKETGDAPGLLFPTVGICCSGGIQLALNFPEKSDYCPGMKPFIRLL